jgi:hypothetical protein
MGSPVGGIDALPCTPNAYDDEFTDTNGIANTNNPEYTIVQTASTPATTYTLTGGMISLATANRGAHHLSCIFKPLPATPWDFNTVMYTTFNGANNNVSSTGIALYESATGKI